MRDIFLDKLKAARKYYDEAMAIQSGFTGPEGIMRYGSERAAFIACAQDIRWQEAVENEKFAERLANMYGAAALLQELERHYKELDHQSNMTRELVQEQKKTNELLQKILQSSHD